MRCPVLLNDDIFSGKSNVQSDVYLKCDLRYIVFGLVLIRNNSQILIVNV